MIKIDNANANAQVVYPTLKKYKEVYSKLLVNYLKEYEDNTEKRFVELQIEHHKNFCNDFLHNPKHIFNKFELERFYTSRLLVVEYLEAKLKSFSTYIESPLDLKLPTNHKANELFKMIVDNYRYDEITNVKYVNIWYYMRNDINKNVYTYELTQTEYRDLIQKEFKFKMSKFAKSSQYFEKEKPILDKIEKTFRHTEAYNL